MREYFVRFLAPNSWRTWCVFPKARRLISRWALGGGIPRSCRAFRRGRWTVGAQKRAKYSRFSTVSLSFATARRYISFQLGHAFADEATDQG